MDDSQQQQQQSADLETTPQKASPAAGTDAELLSPKSPTAVAGGSSGAKRKAGSYTTSHPHDPAAAGQELLQKLSFYITQLGGTLGDGWKCNVTIVTVTDNGETGTCNAAYIGPNGKRYRTRAEVAKFLGLDVPTGKGARMSGHGPAGTAAAAGSGPGSSSKAPDAAAAGGLSPTAHGDQQQQQDSGISKAEAYATAVHRAAQLKADGIQLPFRCKNGTVVEQLGTVDVRPTFSTPLSIMTVGYRAIYDDPTGVGVFVSEIKAPPGAKHPQFVVSFVVQQQQLEQIEATGGSSSRTSVPGLGLPGTQQQQVPVSNGNASSSSRTFELVTARNADIAWAQVVSLQDRAKMQVEAAAAAGLGPAAASSAAAAVDPANLGLHADEAIDQVLAQILAKAESVKGCWGKAMYGFADVEVLQMIEALPSADRAANYQFVDQRGGWHKEREFLTKGRWAKRSSMQIGVKKTTPPKQQQQPAGSGKKRPHPAAAAAAAAAATAGSDSALFGPSANKRYRAMDRDDRQIAGAVDKVLDKMIKKVELWWVNETAREARKAEKAEARHVAGEARKAARAAARELAEKDSGTPDRQQQQRSQPAAAALREDLLLPGARRSVAPAAAAALSILRGHEAEQLLQIWEFACCFGPMLGLDQIPSVQQLEIGVLGLVSHTGTMASSMLDRVDAPGSSSSSSQQQQQGMLDQDQAPDQISLAAAAARSPAAAALGVGQGQIESEAAAGNRWIQLHTAVLSILIEDAFTAVSTATFDTQHMKAAQLKELRTAMPVVDVTTWPEAARRYLAAAAAATYLAQGEPKSSAISSNAKELDMPGHLKSMEVQDWAQYLCAGLNVPDLISRIALLPQGSSETAAESLLMLDDAAALAAAEQTLQQLAKQQQQQQQTTNAGAMDVDGNDPTATQQQPQQQQEEDPSQQQQQDPDQQQLIGRRLLQALVKVWGEKSKNQNGQRMCFYAQELNPKLGRARGLDLHSVAARLEKGLYQATGDPLQALAADVVLACDLWRDAFNTFDMSHEEGFRTADGRLADAVEERLQQLLQQIREGSDLADVAGLGQPGQSPEDQAGKLEGQAGLDQGPDGQAAEPDGQAGQDQGPDGQAAGPDGQAGQDQGPDGQAAGPDGQAGQDKGPDVQARQGQGAGGQAAGSAQPQQQQQIVPAAVPQQETAAIANTTAVEVADGQTVGLEPLPQQQGAAAAAGATVVEGADAMDVDGPRDGSPVTAAAANPDPHGLRDPKRPFNPLAGCRVCWREDDKARLLLCDGCEDEYHCYCVIPALLEVPEGDWYCPVCSSKGTGPSDQGLAPAPSAAAAGSSRVGTAAAAAADQQQPGSSSSSWDLAASAQLPLVTGSTEPIWDRPGMQYIKELIGTAQQLAAVPYGSWPVAARLSLLLLLCELLAASHAGRRFVDERMEQKVQAKRKIAELKARLNKAKKEAAEAAKAARRRAADGGETSVAATADDTTVKEETADTAAAAAKPTNGKPPKGKKAAAAAAADLAAAKLTRVQGLPDEPINEEVELQNISTQQQLIEVSNVRRLCLGQDRFRNTYWLLGTSQLQIAGDPAAAAVAGVEGDRQRQQQDHKGPDQQQQQSGSSTMGTYGEVLIQPADPDPAAAAADQQVAAAAAAAAEAAEILAAVLPPTVPLPPLPKGDIGPLRSVSDCSSSSSKQQQLLAALRQQQVVSSSSRGDLKPWGVFKKVTDIDALISWLNPQGLRESALRAALKKVRDNMVLFAPETSAAAAAAEGGSAEQQQQQLLQGLLEGDVKGSRAGSPYPVPGAAAATAAAAAVPAESKHPKLVLKFKLQKQHQDQQQQQQQQQAINGSTPVAAAAASGTRSDPPPSSLPQQQPSVPTAADLQQQLLAAAAAADDLAAAAALRLGLDRLASSIPELSMHEFWGNESRKDAWYAALAAAKTPADFAALVTTFEIMVLTDSWRLGFQIWAVPAQHPGLVETWPQVWYRFLGVESAKRPGLPTRQQRDRALELAWRSQAKDRTVAGQQQQQQQRKCPRYDLLAGEEDGWEDETTAAAAAGGGGGGGSSKRKQQQQQQQVGPRSSRSAAAVGSGGRLTRGRQQREQELDLFAPRSGRAAAAKAAAAIHQQSAGLAAAHAGSRSRHNRYSEDDDEDLADYSEYSSENERELGSEDEQQQDDDAALAAALAADGHHYPRRAAAVAATAAMAAASGHQQQQQQQRGRHTRLTRGSNQQSGRSAAGAAVKTHKQQQQQQRKAGSSKGKNARSSQRRSRSQHEGSDSDLEEVYSELSEGSREVPNELEDDISSDLEDHSDLEDDLAAAKQQQQQRKGKGGQQQKAKGLKSTSAAAAAAAAVVDADKQQQGQSQQQQLQQEAVPDRGKQQKRLADHAAAAAATQVDEQQQQQDRPSKRPRTGGEVALHQPDQQQQQQQQQQVEQNVVPAQPGAAAEDGSKAAAAATAAPKPTTAAAAAAAKPKALPSKLTIKKTQPQPPKSKTEALQSLLGGAAAPLSTLSRKPAAAAAGSSAGTKAPDTTTAGDGKPSSVMSPKKMLLQRHESDLQQQLQQQQQQHKQKGLVSASGASGSGSFRHLSSTSPRAAAVGHFSGGGKGRLSAAEQRAKADPKVASKEKVAWSDEDDD